MVFSFIGITFQYITVLDHPPSSPNLVFSNPKIKFCTQVNSCWVSNGSEEENNRFWDNYQKMTFSTLWISERLECSAVEMGKRNILKGNVIEIYVFLIKIELQHRPHYLTATPCISKQATLTATQRHPWIYFVVEPCYLIVFEDIKLHQYQNNLQAISYFSLVWTLNAYKIKKRSSNFLLGPNIPE